MFHPLKSSVVYVVFHISPSWNNRITIHVFINNLKVFFIKSFIFNLILDMNLQNILADSLVLLQNHKN